MQVSQPDWHADEITLNFRDPEYSAHHGGFHPVEMRLVKACRDSQFCWAIDYMTDFSYQGTPYPELVKEIDICFLTKRVYYLYSGELKQQDAYSLITLFLQNFIRYYQMGVFKVTVTFD